MTAAAALLERCRSLDIRLWADDGSLRYNAPCGTLTPELRGALLDRKAELIDLLSDRSPAAALAEKDSGIDPPPLPAPPDRWRCLSPFCRHGERWWMSRWGVVNCLNCVPPAFDSLVVAQGPAADAPLVEAGRSHQAVVQLAPAAANAGRR